VRIGLRIFLGYFAIVALAALLLSQVFVAQVKPGVRQAMEDTLVDMANVLAELAADDFAAGRIGDGRFAARVRALQGRDVGAAIWGFPKRAATTRVYVTDARGIVVFDSGGRDVGADYSRWNDVHLTLRGRYGARSSAVDPADPESTVMHVAAPVRDPTGRIVGSLTVAKPNSVIAPFIQRSQGVVIRWGVVLLGVALLVGIAAAWWLSGQLALLQAYARAATAGERAPLPRTSGEFARLAEALETMRNRLEGKQYVEQYVHALTHEMKGPLAAIRASAELLERPMEAADRVRFAEAIGAQSARLQAMIERMLALAAVEHRQRLEAPRAVDVRALFDDVAADARTRLDARGQRLHVAVDNVQAVQGDAFLLRQALGNLVENASDFSPAAAAIELHAGCRDGRIELAVRDRGAGVPDYARERIFERFYSLPRPDGGSRSSGLGLGFVAEVADLHGGSAHVAPRAGGGTVATIVLPG
jgi:two-component system sensor histidine kinase CreC